MTKELEAFRRIVLHLQPLELREREDDILTVEVGLQKPRINNCEIKQAWNYLLDEIKKLETILTRKEQKKILDKLDVIKSYLSPPTVEEVCNALSDYFGYDYYYQDGFFYKSDGIKYVWFMTRSGVDEIFYYWDSLPPHLITLIGRFYEGPMRNDIT